MAVQEEIKFVNLEQSNSTRHYNIKKSASLPSVLFALGCFSIGPVQNLGEPHEYKQSRIKKPHEYGYSRVEESNDYGYFRTEERHGYGYSILKRSGGDIQGIHNFQNFGKLRRSYYKYKYKLIIRLRDLAFKAKRNIIIREHITFCDKKYYYTTCVAICDVTAGYLKTIYFLFVSKFLFPLSSFLDFIYLPKLNLLL